jgi:threonine aldolase
LTAEAGVALHCDGARIWNASIATGVDLATYGALFDTMSVCLSKGLGAPVGSVILAPAALADEARVLRRRLGGGWRQAGVLAAAGLYALDHHLGRLADDHARARRLAETVADIAPGVCAPELVETNVVQLDLTKHPLAAADVQRACAEREVLVGVMGPRHVRLVTHLDVDDDGIQVAERALREVLAS